MRYIVPNDDKVRTIPLGRAGEKNYTEIAFDISAWQKEFSTIDSVAILMQGRNDATAYIGDVVIDGKYAVHTLTDNDLAFAGNGKCQLVLTSGDVIAKSKVYSTICYCSLDASDTPPSPRGLWWVGTQDEYDALTHYPYVIYFIVDEVAPPLPKIPAGIYGGVPSGIPAPLEFDITLPITFTQAAGEFQRTADRISADTEGNIIAWESEEDAELIGAYIHGGVFLGSLDDGVFTVTADTGVSQEDYDAFMTYFTAAD